MTNSSKLAIGPRGECGAADGDEGDVILPAPLTPALAVPTPVPIAPGPNPDSGLNQNLTITGTPTAAIA